MDAGQCRRALPAAAGPRTRHESLGVLVLLALQERSFRFSELRREIGGVSEKMLTQTLQTLERDGMVHRDAKPVIPPRSTTPAHRAGPGKGRGAGPLARRVDERRLPAVVSGARGVRRVPGPRVVLLT